MDSIIFNPVEDYDKRFRELHKENTQKAFSDLTERSGINVEKNKKTVKKYDEQKEICQRLGKKLSLLKALRVLSIAFAIIFVIAAFAIIYTLAGAAVLLLVWLLALNPAIKKLKPLVDEAEKKAQELLELAYSQVAPLNSLFDKNNAIRIIETTIPRLDFSSCHYYELEKDMIENYDLSEIRDEEHSTVDTLSGRYNENPFFFERKLIHQMGTEIYHGYKTIHWTESYTDSNGHRRTRTRSQTLHATVAKPKPFYHTENSLNYGAQGGPELSFSRDASGLHQKSDKEIERLVKKGEKKLQKKDADAIEDNKSFVSMSNTTFEVLFDALDRTHEVQFRTLFTPLAQTNMEDLIRSRIGYGDDFNFYKMHRMNRIVTGHSQGRELFLSPDAYRSYSYEIIRENFITKNVEYFKSIYFDFAPLWAIPMYQDRPVHSLKPLPDYSQRFSLREYEALANAMSPSSVAHPHSKTQAILKSSFDGHKGEADRMTITAYSYDTVPRVDFVTMMGGDGRFHSVAVHWSEYIPLRHTTSFLVSDSKEKLGDKALAYKNGLYAVSAN